MIAGRERELAELRQLAERAAAGAGAVLLLTGESGIGKTAVLQAFAAGGGLGPLLPVFGHASGPGETALLGPWREVMAELRGRVTGEPPALQETAAENALALLGWLGSAGRPLLIALEDLHWADQATLDLLRHMAPRLSRQPLLVVATCRTAEAAGWLGELQRGGALVMPLERLSPEAVAEAAEAMLPSAPGLTGLARYVHQRTGGHPLFVRELLAAYARGGSSLGMQAREEPLPETVQQAIDRRLSRLSPGALLILQAAAVLGERFGFDLLTQVTEVTEEQVLTALEEALALRIIQTEGTGGDRFAFDHALLRDGVLARVLGPRRRRWHARAAETLLAAAAPDAEVLAHHLERAGDPRAPLWLMKAGDRSLRLWAVAEAAQRYERALGLLAPDAGSGSADPVRAELLLKLGYARYQTDAEGARAAWEQAIQASPPPAVAVWCRHALATARYWAGDPDCLPLLEQVQAEQEQWLADLHYRQIETDLFGQPCGYPRIAGSRALALARSGRQVEGRALLDAMFARAEPGTRRADLLYHEYWLAGSTGKVETALDLGGLVVEEAIRHGDYRMALRVEGNRLFEVILSRADHPDEVDEGAARVQHLLRLAGEQAGQTLQHFPSLGWHCFLRGDWEGARHHLLGYLQQHPDMLEPGVRGMAVQLQLALGDVAGARATLAPVPPRRPEDPPLLHSMQITAYTVRAQLAMLAGAMEQARAWLEAADRFMAERQQVAFRSALQLTWARWHYQMGALAEARVQAEAALAYASERGELRFIVMAGTLLGEVLIGLGLKSEGAEKLRRALDLAKRCRWPYYASLAQAALEQAARSVPELTPRERDVMLLVARGLSDKEVGAQLHISPRTVDGHLRNIFGKLGLTNRTALAAYATRHGLLQ